MVSAVDCRLFGLEVCLEVFNDLIGVFGNVLFDNEENRWIFLGSIVLYDSDCILAISHCQHIQRIYYLLWMWSRPKFYYPLPLQRSIIYHSALAAEVNVKDFESAA
jgi:hypothetical protein